MSASEASKAVLSPPQITFRLASLAEFFFFFAHTDFFFPLPPNAKPGPRLVLTRLFKHYFKKNSSPKTLNSPKIVYLKYVNARLEASSIVK